MKALPPSIGRWFHEQTEFTAAVGPSFSRPWAGPAPSANGKPARRPFVRPELLRRDLEAYAGAGIRNITSFAVYMDGEYFSAHGTAALEDYAAALREFLPDDGSVPGAGAVRPDSENQVPCY